MTLSLAWRVVAVLALCCVSMVAFAAPEAWLDRNRIALGDTVTLHVATTGTAAPDFSPLEAAGLSPRPQAAQRRFELVNGQASMRTLFTVVLRPPRAGRTAVPAISVGTERTAPLALEVTAAPAAPPARAGDDVFIETQPDDVDPYVQQAVGWVVRLYSAVPLVSGHLDQPSPEGASMQRVGDDVQYTRELDGRRYTVVERRFLLVPERSGELVVPGAKFEGRGVGGFFDSVFGDRGGALAATGAVRVLGVRPVPTNAPTPWLPLRDLQLRYRELPDTLQAGRAAAVSVELVADGAFAAQLPELTLPPIDGVEVFAEPPQSDERFVDGRPQVTLTRRFSLVPAQAGPVALPALEWPWWDVDTGGTRTATLPAQQWQARPGVAASPVLPGVTDAPAQDAPADAAPDASATGRWLAIAALAVAAWVLTMAWAARRRAARGVGTAEDGEDGAATPGSVTPTQDARPDAAAAPAKPADLRRTLERGTPDEILAALRALSPRPAPDTDALIGQLDDAAQRDALQALQRARWGGGDPAAALDALRRAFAPGPRWRETRSARKADPLPPLYPER
ncbi:BatD family protein [Cognatilysobacter bugurensis]|uniref:Membrane protein n=1 Tax=Cognatilysobacter bugurensis TaxID=543356 RepID=A0A918T1I6_9GAMM|nr:BatD family protein [Lysobacter bugurensis]GHA84648.1 membrane protein [Lysobacter bugurensis]